MGYFSSNPTIEQTVQLIRESEGKFDSIEQLYELLNNVGWCEMSVYSKGQWKSENKCNGQCNATVLIVREYFGGDIIEYPNPTSDKKMHFFNRIGGVDVDLTADQFMPKLSNYDNQKKIVKTKGRQWSSYKKSAMICILRMGLSYFEIK